MAWVSGCLVLPGLFFSNVHVGFMNKVKELLSLRYPRMHHLFMCLEAVNDYLTYSFINSGMSLKPSCIHPVIIHLLGNIYWVSTMCQDFGYTQN